MIWKYRNNTLKTNLQNQLNNYYDRAWRFRLIDENFIFLGVHLNISLCQKWYLNNTKK